MNITNEIAEIIQCSERILISSHIRLDGDAIGSELALYHALKKLDKHPDLSSGQPSHTQEGKGEDSFQASSNEPRGSCIQNTEIHISKPYVHRRELDLINDSLIPRVYQFLPGVEDVETSVEEMGESYDLLVALDCPTIERLGNVYENLCQQRSLGSTSCQPPLHQSKELALDIVNIDHHISNCSFGTINWVDSNCSSTGELIYHLIKDMSIPIDEAIATNLYVAIITDTGRFIQSNTTSSCLKIAGELIERGANPEVIGAHIYRANTIGQLQLQSLAMQTLNFSDDKKIVCMRLTQEMFRRTGTYPIDTQELVDIPRSIEGVEVAILLRELDQPNMVKISLRSTDSVNVSKIAARFGGGGHYHAAGCEFEGSLDEAESEFMEIVKEELA